MKVVENGRTKFEYECVHSKNGTSYRFRLWAYDYEDAKRRCRNLIPKALRKPFDRNRISQVVRSVNNQL